MIEEKCIRVWIFQDAPEHYKKMSDHGGDEDGIALIPKGVEIPHWMTRMWNYDDPTIIELPEGQLVIWSH